MATPAPLLSNSTVPAARARCSRFRTQARRGARAAGSKAPGASCGARGVVHGAVLSPLAESFLVVSPASSVSTPQSLSACSPPSFPRRWGFQGVRTPLGPRRRGTPASPHSEGQSCGPGSSFPFDSPGGSSFSPRQGRRQEALPPDPTLFPGSPGTPWREVARRAGAGMSGPDSPGGLGGW